ncbi:MAG: ABC transporter substrate-binding protein [Lachnospiraceae bacterium]|nr:ABC transporter substrate-binding protein [Lachnospiraceae bacterium]
MKKKLLALLLAVAMIGTLVACGGGKTSDGGDKKASSGDEVVLTIFNSKSEIQSQFEEMAAEYSDSHEGVKVEVYYSSDTVAAHMATKYSSKEPYALAMVDAKDIYSLGADHALDLSEEKWVENTEYAIGLEDKVLGFPVCVEARGLMYNADAIKNITGEDFDPASIATTEDFDALCQKLVDGGMAAPTGIMKEDWSLAAHFLAEFFEEQEDVDAYVDSLYKGEADVAGNAKFNSLMDTFDVLKKYNYAADSPVAAERETSEQKLAAGEIAFMFGGNWDWSLIAEYEPTENLGMCGVPETSDNSGSEYLVGGGSKYFMIDNSEYTTDEQKQAAKDFLNWLVFEEDGNKFLTEKCALVPAYSNIDASALDPLSKSVKAYADAGKLIPSYNYAPDDHYAVVGAAMQKYLAGEADRAAFAEEIVNYWKSTTPVEK